MHLKFLECPNLYGIYEKETGNKKIQYMINEDGFQLHILGTDGMLGSIVFGVEECIGDVFADIKRIPIQYVNSTCTLYMKNNALVETITKMQCNKKGDNINSVSYTHLTLPTICSV